MSHQDESVDEETEQNQLLFIEEVAELLRVHTSTIYRWVRLGRLPVIRLSASTLRVDPTDLEKFINAKRMRSVLSRTRGRSWQAFIREANKEFV